ncbi:UDP-galactopyranose mutase [bacterium]|jgi:UDP-galactopyranose mutase|nr:UDP-galactopyranose mutase [bacterium]
MELSGLKYLVVGSGFFGGVIAREIADKLNEKVVVIDQRDHIAGNCFSKEDEETGIEYHKYGPHIFHTSNEKVWDYVNRFADFNAYRHRVFSKFEGTVYSMPINLATINQFYGKNMSPDEAKAFIEKEKAAHYVEKPANLEEKAINLIGKPLYEAFIRGYTIKQWETDPKDLPASIINRLPVRFNFNADYFNDTWQGIPSKGYTALFENLLDSPLIDVHLGVDYFKMKDQIPADCKVIYTGPIDRLLDYKYGVLGWRTVSFERECVETEDQLGNSVMNYADADNPYTRTHEFRHYHPEREYTKDKTVLFHEKSRTATEEDDPYYPINTDADKALFKKYQADAEQIPNLVVGGRLGSYRYWDMHHAIAAALAAFETQVKP